MQDNWNVDFVRDDAEHQRAIGPCVMCPNWKECCREAACIRILEEGNVEERAAKPR